MPPERAEDYRGIIARIARGERVEHYETTRRRKDGTLVEVAVTASPVRDEDGRIIAVSKTARDLTPWREIERDRERTRELFLATLGHDLRNPLNAITASLFYLRRHAPEPLQHVVERMSGSGDRMARMIGQLLDFTRTRLGGGIEVAPRPCDLRQVCRTVLAEVEMQYPERFRFARRGGAARRVGRGSPRAGGLQSRRQRSRPRPGRGARRNRDVSRGEGGRARGLQPRGGDTGIDAGRDLRALPAWIGRAAKSLAGIGPRPLHQPGDHPGPRGLHRRRVPRREGRILRPAADPSGTAPGRPDASRHSATDVGSPDRPGGLRGGAPASTRRRCGPAFPGAFEAALAPTAG